MVILCVLRCLLNLLGDIVDYINSYAFVYVALYGDSYLQSAKNLWKMFKSKGIEALINDDLVKMIYDDCLISYLQKYLLR